MSEYWLISAPGDKTCQQTFDTMNNLTSKQNNLCNNFKFHIPDLKVGTLDQLVGLSDDLGKLDTYVEQITRKVAGYLGEVLEDQRDKLHENLQANNSPGPPDESMHSTTHTHSELTGKASNLSNSRDTTTTTITTNSTCSACQHTTTTSIASASPGAAAVDTFSATTTTEQSERDYDYTASASASASSSASPVCCHCDECAASVAASVRPSNTTTTIATTLSAGTTASAASDECCHLRHHPPHHLQQHHLHQPHSPLPAPPSACSSPTAYASANQMFSSVARAAAAAAAACAISTVNATTSHNTKYAASDGHGGSFYSRSAPNAASKMNNNTCCINNNSKWSDSFNHNHPAPQTAHQQQHQHHQSHQQLPQFPSHHHHHTHLHQHQLHHQLHQQLHLTESGRCVVGGGAHAGAAGFGGCGRGSCDAAASGKLRSSNSTSDVGDTFDWWFYRHKRPSKKSRSSPVSSCCGSSSHGRSSPDTDIGDPPAFPLSPGELSAYITRFQWDMAKYPIKQSLRNIADIISKQIGQIDADLKTKSSAYNNLKGSLQNLEKKQTGSLLTRNLADLVKKEHFILDSEYLTTLLVIVPKMMANDWSANYEKITDMIVPRSSTLITQDNDYCLFNVTLFKKVVEEFKLHAREKKFIVRDFVYNEEELAAGKNEITKLITDKKKQFGPLVRWLKVNFSESFCALVHVKALRVFVESVLRYGLPVNFQAILIEPNKKSVKRLRDCLNQLYGHLDGASAAGGQGSNSDNVDIPGLGFGQSEYFPYVFYKLNIDMVETAKI